MVVDEKYDYFGIDSETGACWGMKVVETSETKMVVVEPIDMNNYKFRK